MESKFVAFLLIWVGFAIATAMIAKRKGHVGSTWFALGMIGGVIALFIAILIKEAEVIPTPETHVKCPDCKELVLKEARVCKHCGCKLIPSA